MCLARANGALDCHGVGPTRDAPGRWSGGHLPDARVWSPEAHARDELLPCILGDSGDLAFGGIARSRAAFAVGRVPHEACMGEGHASVAQGAEEPYAV